MWVLYIIYVLNDSVVESELCPQTQQTNKISLSILNFEFYDHTPIRQKVIRLKRSVSIYDIKNWYNDE